MASEVLGRASGWKPRVRQKPTVTCRDRSGHGQWSLPLLVSIMICRLNFDLRDCPAGTPTTQIRLRASHGPPSPTAAGAAAAVCTGCLWAGQVRCTCRPSLIPLTGQIRVSGAQSAMASEVPGWAFGWKLRPCRPERAETAPAVGRGRTRTRFCSAAVRSYHRGRTAVPEHLLVAYWSNPSLGCALSRRPLDASTAQRFGASTRGSSQLEVQGSCPFP